MSDDQNAPEVPDENNFMLAAEAAIRALRDQADAAAKAAEIAKTAAAETQKSAKRWKVLSVVMAVFVVLGLGTSGVTGYYVNQTSNNANGLRQQSIASCESGNDLRSQLDLLIDQAGSAQAKLTETALNELIGVLEGKNPSAQTKLIAESLENQIKDSANATLGTLKKALDKATTARNCQEAYQSTSTGASSTSGVPRATEEAVTWTVEQIQSWNGGCLTVATAAAGTPVSEISCGSAHNWVLGSNGQLSPQGHTNVSIGDSGGHFVLKTSVTPVQTDTAKSGPEGFTYDRMYFGVNGTYWHANGNGSDVTFLANPGSSLAVYYAFLDGGLNSALNSGTASV